MYATCTRTSPSQLFVLPMHSPVQFEPLLTTIIHELRTCLNGASFLPQIPSRFFAVPRHVHSIQSFLQFSVLFSCRCWCW